MRPVRRTDLGENHTRGLDEVGQAEARPDLDELAPADEDGRVLRVGGGREHEGGGAVVDDEGVLGGRAGSEQGRAGPGASAGAGPGGEVELEVGVSGRVGERRPGGLGQRRPAQVRVDEHACGVEDRCERGGALSAESGQQLRLNGLGRDGAGAGTILRGSDEPLDDALAQGGDCGFHRRQGQQGVGAGDAATGVAGAAGWVAVGWFAGAADEIIAGGTACLRAGIVRHGPSFGRRKLGGGGRESNPPSPDTELRRF